MHKVGSPRRAAVVLALSLSLLTTVACQAGPVAGPAAGALAPVGAATVSAGEPSATTQPSVAPPTATATVAPTETPPPTATSTPTDVPPTPTVAPPTPTLPPPTETPAPLHLPAAPAVNLEGLGHEWQTMNNCGPASLSALLQYYGSGLRQVDIAATIRPHPDDRGVSMEEMADFARAQGFAVLDRVAGTSDLLKTFVTNGVPVLILSWFETHDDAMAHFRVVSGYDDATAQWTVYDSLRATKPDWQAPYHGIQISYAEMDRLWGILNNRYLLIYPPERDALVRSILGDPSEEAMWAASLERARQAAEAQPDALALGVLGANLAARGDWAGAAEVYDRARALGLPYRYFWYQFGIAEAYYNLDRHDDVIALANATLGATWGIEEWHYWRGRSLLAQGNAEEARQAFQRAVTLRPTYAAAQQALAEMGG